MIKKSYLPTVPRIAFMTSNNTWRPPPSNNRWGHMITWARDFIQELFLVHTSLSLSYRGTENRCFVLIIHEDGFIEACVPYPPPPKNVNEIPAPQLRMLRILWNLRTERPKLMCIIAENQKTTIVDLSRIDSIPVLVFGFAELAELAVPWAVLQSNLMTREQYLKHDPGVADPAVIQFFQHLFGRWRAKYSEAIRLTWQYLCIEPTSLITQAKFGKLRIRRVWQRHEFAKLHLQGRVDWARLYQRLDDVLKLAKKSEFYCTYVAALNFTIKKKYAAAFNNCIYDPTFPSALYSIHLGKRVVGFLYFLFRSPLLDSCYGRDRIKVQCDRRHYLKSIVIPRLRAEGVDLKKTSYLYIALFYLDIRRGNTGHFLLDSIINDHQAHKLTNLLVVAETNSIKWERAEDFWRSQGFNHFQDPIRKDIVVWYKLLLFPEFVRFMPQSKI